MINVTQTCLPPLEEYVRRLEGIWERKWLTNQGQLVLELEQQLTRYLGVPHLQYMANGTIALQLALKALDITGEVITTPFSYVATTSAILWEHCQPVFVDIEDTTFCIDAEKIERAITPQTQAILATHVYGFPCAVREIAAIAGRHGLKVIYDGAHAFGVRWLGEPLVNFGDLTTLSFHATKLFHTVEGGAVVSHSQALHEKLWLLKSFGHHYDNHFTLGINGKDSELHAAMGLCLLPRVPEFIAQRKVISETYDAGLQDTRLRLPRRPAGLEYNYAYYPVLFADEPALLRGKAELEKHGVNPRRYFHPSLNRLPYHTGAPCPISENIVQRVLCLPLYPALDLADVERIAGILQRTL